MNCLEKIITIVLIAYNGNRFDFKIIEYELGICLNKYTNKQITIELEDPYIQVKIKF